MEKKMKLAKFLVAIISLSFLLSFSSFAQEEEMTKEEWEAEMTRLTGKKQALMSEIETLNKDMENLNTVKAGLQDPEQFPHQPVLDRNQTAGRIVALPLQRRDRRRALRRHPAPRLHAQSRDLRHQSHVMFTRRRRQPAQ